MTTFGMVVVRACGVIVVCAAAFAGGALFATNLCWKSIARGHLVKGGFGEVVDTRTGERQRVIA